jgi:hypothetical protein
MCRVLPLPGMAVTSGPVAVAKFGMNELKDAASKYHLQYIEGALRPWIVSIALVRKE